MNQLLESRGRDTDVDLSRDTSNFEEKLFCGQCGERFLADQATQDGWYYRCPNEDCEGEGIHEDLYPVKDVLPSTH